MVIYFLEKISIRKFFTIQVMGSVLCGSAAAENKPLPDSMSGRQSSRGFTFNTKSAVAVSSILAIELPK
jgi:hypothetical protein